MHRKKLFVINYLKVEFHSGEAENGKCNSRTTLTNGLG